ncbi:helix-turn-helix domain-containing protein [Murinocardiopsis flavida]|nr:helix-turn-helix transcriptional regulator [Murinocardiopsis flavida]
MAMKIPPTENHTLRQFGIELARLRSLAEKSQRDIGVAAQVSGQLAGAIERGERYPSKEFAEQADQMLQGDGILIDLWERLHNDSYPHFIGELVDAEPLAVIIRAYEPQLIPGLLQTEGYARATLTAGNSRAPVEVVERLVVGRMKRQNIWNKRNPAHMIAIVDETVIRRPIGPAGVMSSQIGRFLDMIEQRILKLLVIPTGRGQHPGLTGPFTLLSLTDGRDLVYVEDALSGRMVHTPGAVRAMVLQFGDLQEVALSPDESHRLLKDAKEGFDGSELA